MIPVTMDFECWANADYTEEFQFTVDGIGYDLTGVTLDIDARRFPRSSDTVFTLNAVTTDVEGLRIIDANSGVIEIRIARTTLETAYVALAENSIANAIVTASYDLRFTHTDGLREVAIQGVIAINPGVTRL
jgi:hypothetical protein